MTVLDVTTGALEVTEISWCEGGYFNLIRKEDEITISWAGVVRMYKEGVNLACDKEDAENLIKALQKAIDLGWVK